MIRFFPRRSRGPALAFAVLLGLWAGALGGAAFGQGVELPSGGGTFIPFRGGPGGGLGVSPSGMRPSPSAGSPSSFMGGMSGATGGPGTLLGAPGGLTAPRPIGVGGMGRGMGTGGLLNRPSPRGMPSMPRPPVGYYPFRIPPSLRGTAAAAPAMAM